MRRALKWAGGFLLLAILLPVAYVALFGWNWLREPVSRLATEKTGRELVIGGDLHQGDLGIGERTPRQAAQ